MFGLPGHSAAPADGRLAAVSEVPPSRGRCSGADLSRGGGSVPAGRLSGGGPRRGITPRKAVELSKSNGTLPAVRTAPVSAGIGGTAGTGTAQPPQPPSRPNALASLARPVLSCVQFYETEVFNCNV